MQSKKVYRFLVPCFFFTTLAGAANAQPILAADAEEPRYDDRTEVDLGMLAGGSDIGPDKRSTFGLHMGIGRRFGDLVLLGEYSYLAIGKPDSQSRGAMNRLGVVARYSLLRTKGGPGARSAVSGDYWLEAGAGMQRVTWDAGGTLERPDLVLGFGWQLDAVIGRRTRKPRYFGPYVAFRASLSRAPESTMELVPTCAGPCDTETTPSQNDVSMFFHFGLNWGR